MAITNEEKVYAVAYTLVASGNGGNGGNGIGRGEDAIVYPQTAGLRPWGAWGRGESMTACMR